jgi:hypothetical protein
VLDELKAFLEDVKRLRSDVKSITTSTVSSKDHRDRAEALGSKWCSEISAELGANDRFQADLIARYTEGFSKLIALSAPSNRKSSYLSTLDLVTKDFRKDFVLPVQQGKVKISGGSSTFDAFLSKIAPSDEGAYFKEAISCAKHGYLRAATVMAWCTAIDRIHQKIEEIGFPAFNVTSAQMASQTAGRFKRFNQTQNVGSLSDLREVFDSTVLWIIEGMGLIDSNQHTRLRSCFEMRCHSAHPGEAPTTEYNLLSCFSDIEQIVLANPKFALKRAVPGPARS